ncbi:MAG: Asp23/Gls24 family envelope stress response protein [Anaerolineales bacterium]|nr:Asp23/Gls24 family envelope stress response protein [Anaerolineales bacterium]
MKDQPIGKEQSADYDQTVGKTTIAPEVLITIARLTALDVPGVSRMGNVPGAAKNLFTRSAGEGVRIDITDDMVSADLYIILKNDVNIRDVSRQVQHNVARAVSEMVGMQVGRVNIHIEDIDYPSETGSESIEA